MATGINFVKIVSNLFRNRLHFVPELSEMYKPAITRNKGKLLEVIREKTERAMNTEIARKIRVAKAYYTLEMSPPNMNEMERLKADLALLKEFIQTGCFRYLTVKQAWLLFLVGTEIGLWFFLGETIGKMHFVGYKV